MPRDGLRLTTHILKQLQRGNLEMYQKALNMEWGEVWNKIHGIEKRRKILVHNSSKTI